MHEWMFDAVSGLHGDLSASEKLEAFSLKTVIETAVDAYECCCAMQRVTISYRHDIVLNS